MDSKKPQLFPFHSNSSRSLETPLSPSQPRHIMTLPTTVVALLLAGVAYTISYIISRLLRARRIARLSRELQCEKPPVLKSHWPLGIDTLMRSMKAVGDNLYPTVSIERTQEIGSVTYSFSILGTENLYTADEENIKAMLAVQFKDFDLGAMRRGNFWPLLGNGIFTQDGPGWEHSRAMMRPQFARDQISDLDMEECHVQNMMRALELCMAKDGSGNIEDIDLQILFFRLTLDSATEFLFGKSVETQVHLLGHNTNGPIPGLDNSVRAKFAFAFDGAQKTLAIRARLVNGYWLFSPPGFKDSCKVCHDFIDEYVHLALNKAKRLQANDVEKDGDAKEKYLFLDALVAQTQDPLELRTQLLNILLAGRDTTASFLGWLFMLLAKDPVRYQKLRDIILAEFGTYENPIDITFARMKSCQYLQQCNNEALRLFPVVPVNSRVANKDTTLPRGGGKDGKSKIFVPKGTPVDYSVHVMHRRKDLWGEDANEFNPERWQGRKVGWEFLPFNGGPRICIGQQFALTGASYAIIRLLQRFDSMSYLGTEAKELHNLTLTSCNANGVRVRAHAVC
ncbi:cytochrome P450 [Blumeria hordei DH14]|uniref:Cytochrome P450 n=2 Tax=Blumeria hordei TaxID=2867405 RepID=N1JHB2_BLUG1|nr:cytochrome P450 [Blumeria hordei DH14]